MRPRRADFMAAFLRTFAIQGSWNYRTLIGGGLTYALVPLLERIHAGDPVALRESVERHAREFNAHPYLSPVAVGALARLEHEGEEPATIERFRAALRGPLGAVGDQAVWAGWRPLCTFGAILTHVALGVGPLISAVLFLLVYNLGHVALRLWGFRKGWESGLRVGAVLGASGIQAAGRRLVPLNQALIGAAAALLVARAPGTAIDPIVAAVAAGIALAGYLAPGRVAPLAMAALFGAWMMWPF